MVVVAEIKYRVCPRPFKRPREARRVWDGYGTGMGQVWDGYGTGMGQLWDGYGTVKGRDGELDNIGLTQNSTLFSKRVKRGV